MINKRFTVPHNSFMSVEKDTALIVDWMLRDKTLGKLLKHTTKEALNMPTLTEKETKELVYKNIKLVPKLYVDNSVLNYVIIGFDNFVPNQQNNEFRDNIITFDIICHFDQWQLTDYSLRPYRIAAQLDTMFDNQHLTGIGELHFASCNQIVLNDEFAGLSLAYYAIHGGEDKFGTPNPTKNEQMKKDFNELFNAR